VVLAEGALDATVNGAPRRKVGKIASAGDEAQDSLF
jgi:hypothetical protein